MGTLLDQKESEDLLIEDGPRHDRTSGESLIIATERFQYGLEDPDESVDINFQTEGPVTCCANVYFTVMNGHKRCFDAWLRTANLDHLPLNLMAFIAYHGEVLMLSELYSRCLGCQRTSSPRIPWNPLTYRWAAMNDKLDCIKFAHTHGLRMEASSVAFAAAAGHVHIVKWMHEHGFPFSLDVINFAAEGGSINCLKYLLEHPMDCPVASCREHVALMARGLKATCRIHTVLELPHCGHTWYVCVPGEPPNTESHQHLPGGATSIHPKAFRLAAGACRLDVIQYLRSRGGQWCKRMLMHAMSRLSQERTDDAHGNDSKDESQICTDMMELIRWCYDSRAPRPRGMCCVLFDGCEGVGCYNCPSFMNFSISLRTTLEPFLPRELVCIHDMKWSGPTRHGLVAQWLEHRVLFPGGRRFESWSGLCF